MNWTTINEAITQFIADIGDVILDILFTVLEVLIGLIIYLLNLLPLPPFLQDYTLADYIPGEIVWFLNQSGFSIALGIIASAALFKLVRSIATLGWWN